MFASMIIFVEIGLLQGASTATRRAHDAARPAGAIF
jgi:hypothetical protein